MALEDLTGTKYIDSLVSTNPVGATDPKSEGDDHIRGIKNVLLTSFPAVTGAVTSTHTELNILDGVTSTAAELNILDGVTSTAEELNILDGVTATAAELNYVDGVTSNIQTQLDSHNHAGGDGGDITEDAHTAITTGATYRHQQVFIEATITGVSSLTRVPEMALVVQRSGTYQVKFDVKIDNDSGSPTARIYRNPSIAYGGEVAFGTSQSVTAGAYVTKTETLTCNAGDILIIYANPGGVSYTTSIVNFIIESAVKPFG